MIYIDKLRVLQTLGKLAARYYHYDNIGRDFFRITMMNDVGRHISRAFIPVLCCS